MKVNGTGGVGSPASAGGGKRQAAGGFSVGGASPAAPASGAAAATGVSGVASLDALLALQGVDGPTERRRRAVRRAGRILDVLDEVKLALLGTGVGPHQLDRLSAAVREERALADDPRLDAVLGEIETRAAVEMAKLEIAREAA
ncbi:MAG TPA: flagellar assembly protein FliX [Caulobacteraceae bacterium]|jgi:hypothetical protein